MTDYVLRETKDLDRADVLGLYEANRWSSAAKPEQLMAALGNSDTVVTAWSADALIGLGNALSDGALVVYYPHLLVHPDWHGLGVGRAIIARLQERYAGFHQHALIADAPAIGFYERCGFTRAGDCQAMWIYAGGDG
ncbi:MAG TPA: GNAT family N-acetyltransferase [Thalassobaculum sp.]